MSGAEQPQYPPPAAPGGARVGTCGGLAWRRVARERAMSGGAPMDVLGAVFQGTMSMPFSMFVSQSAPFPRQRWSPPSS